MYIFEIIFHNSINRYSIRIRYLDGCAPVDISGEAQLLQTVPVEEGEAAGSCLEGLPGQTLPARLVPVQLGQRCCRLLELNTGGRVSNR
jgi:hypothetical protein